jgi:hypothetical protein
MSGRRGQAGVDGRTGVRPISGPDGCPAADRTPAKAWTPVVLAAATADMLTRAGAAGPGPGLLLPQASAVLVPACEPDTVAARRADGHHGPQCRGRPVRRGVRHSLPPCPGAANRTVAAVSGVQGAANVAVTRPLGVRRRMLPQPVKCPPLQKRSPGRRPLVGCSHRRQARRSCRASRSRSCSRT